MTLTRPLALVLPFVLPSLAAAKPPKPPAPPPAPLELKISCGACSAKAGAKNAPGFTAVLKNRTDKPLSVCTLDKGISLSEITRDGKPVAAADGKDQDPAYTGPDQSRADLAPGAELKLVLPRLMQYVDPDLAWNEFRLAVPGKYQLKFIYRCVVGGERMWLHPAPLTYTVK